MTNPVIDCHTHIDSNWLENDAFELKAMLRHCDIYDVEVMVVSLYVSQGGLELDLQDLRRVFSEFSVRLAVTIGYPPPTTAEEISILPAHLEAALRTARAFAKEPEVVGIGEVGLDYYWPQQEWLDLPGQNTIPLDGIENRENREKKASSVLKKYPDLGRCLEKQSEVFRRWVELAMELDLPLVVHEREAHKDARQVLLSSDIEPGRVMFHCCAASAADAVKAAESGHWISVPSSVVMREPFRSIAQAVPLNRLLSETDAPYHCPMALHWKRLRREARETVHAKGLKGSKLEKAISELSIEHFRTLVEKEYPALQFETWCDNDNKVKMVNAIDYLSKSNRHRRRNESTFVRAVPYTLAELKDEDYNTVCSILADNARSFFRL